MRTAPERDRSRDSEVEAFAWDVQVGMRSTILDDSKEDRAQFNQLLQDADVFFANKRPGFLEKHDLDADALCKQKPGLIHATVVGFVCISERISVSIP
jgi:crotonobetainyl-CoA:carnitine CoA-transferase CaiB-like acyl-CoA transferase